MSEIRGKTVNRVVATRNEITERGKASSDRKNTHRRGSKIMLCVLKHLNLKQKAH